MPRHSRRHAHLLRRARPRQGGAGRRRRRLPAQRHRARRPRARGSRGRRRPRPHLPPGRAGPASRARADPDPHPARTSAPGNARCWRWSRSGCRTRASLDGCRSARRPSKPTSPESSRPLGSTTGPPPPSGHSATVCSQTPPSPGRPAGRYLLVCRTIGVIRPNTTETPGQRTFAPLQPGDAHSTTRPPSVTFDIPAYDVNHCREHQAKKPGTGSATAATIIADDSQGETMSTPTSIAPRARPRDRPAAPADHRNQGRRSRRPSSSSTSCRWSVC